MPTIIDSLLVTLGLDSSEFDAKRAKVDKGLKESGAGADKAADKVKKSGKEQAASFDTVAKSAAKFFAVIGGAVAIKHFVTEQVAANAALDRFSRNLGEGVSTVSAWSNATELAGGSADGLQGTLDMLSKAQTELQLTGQTALIPYLSSLGMSLTDAHGKALPVSDMLLQLSERFQGMNRTTANNMGRMMGIDPGTMNLLLKGRKEVELMTKRQKEYGAVSKLQTEQASRLSRAFTESRQSFNAFGREILSAATPALERLFAIFADIGAWMRDNKEVVNTFLTIMAVGLGAIGAAMIPINLTAAALIAVAGALALLWQDYKTWAEGGESAFDWSKFAEGIKVAGHAARWLRDMLGDAFYRMAAGFDAAKRAMSGDWAGAKRALGSMFEGNGSTYGAEQPAAPGSSPEAAAMSYFQKQGWSKEQAAGLAANIKRESNFDPNAVGDNGKAQGIGQWHPDRQAEFKKLFDKDMKGSTFEEQLAFMQYELTLGNEQAAGNKLRGTSGAAEAAAVVSKHYERPADREGEAAKRGQMALAMLAGVPGAAGAATGAGAMPAGTAGGNQTTTVHVGEVTVHTQATDAAGIARDIGGALNDYLTPQSNYGLT